jgi:hypothetical protein
VILQVPETATPSQTAIIRVYIYETRDPVKIAALLHYKDPSPVYKVLKWYMSEVRKEPIHSSTVTLSLAQ